MGTKAAILIKDGDQCYGRKMATMGYIEHVGPILERMSTVEQVRGIITAHKMRFIPDVVYDEYLDEGYGPYPIYYYDTTQAEPQWMYRVKYTSVISGEEVDINRTLLEQMKIEEIAKSDSYPDLFD